MAPPRKIKSAAELDEKITEFIALCDAGEIDKPTDYRLMEYLQVSHDTMERWSNNEDNYEGYAAVLKKLERYREHYWLSVADNEKKATFAIFNLKQKKNGGYTDKQEIEHKDMKIDISINGTKGNPFA
jgi:nickel-dependent lactate racemase